MDGGKKSYYIKRDPAKREGGGFEVPAAQVTLFPWGGQGPDDFRPHTIAQMAVLKDASLAVFMSSDEKEPRTEEKGYSGLTYTDSCMELFLMPDPENTERYLNWEFNPAGAMYLTLGTCRAYRQELPVDDYLRYFRVSKRVDLSGWQVEYRIPLEFLRKYFPEMSLMPGHRMRGNFYKCGDKTPRPHYGCWSPILLPEPDFHCPDFFGDLILE